MALVMIENTLLIKDPETDLPYRNMVSNFSIDLDMANETSDFIFSNKEQIEKLTHEHYKDLKKAKKDAQERLDKRSNKDKKTWEEIKTLLKFE